jgi:hypothetical protein
MALRVEEVLALWREAERVLEDLPEVDPDRGIVCADVVSLRRMYRSLTDTAAGTEAALTQSAALVAESRAILRRVRARLGEPVQDVR